MVRRKRYHRDERRQIHQFKGSTGDAGARRKEGGAAVETGPSQVHGIAHESGQRPGEQVAPDVEHPVAGSGPGFGDAAEPDVFQPADGFGVPAVHGEAAALNAPTDVPVTTPASATSSFSKSALSTPNSYAP